MCEAADCPCVVGDLGRVEEGTFAGMDGRVVAVHPDSRQVTVSLSIFGRAVPVELAYGFITAPDLTEEQYLGCCYVSRLMPTLRNTFAPSRRKCRLFGCACL